MSRSSIADSDYTAVVELLRSSLSTGAHLAPGDVKYVLAVLKNAVAKTSTAQTATVAQFDILDAFTGGDPAATIVAAIATASTACRAACPAAPSYDVCTNRDG